MNLAPWDIAGGIILVKEVGGVTTNLTGEPVNMLTNDSTLTCHPAIQQEIINDYLQKGKKVIAFMLHLNEGTLLISTSN